ncbi:MAG: PAS domain-containing protein [Anaerolineales bacterium]|nr:PAS domain-containing protein [Anaerolineales bacterium]
MTAPVAQSLNSLMTLVAHNEDWILRRVIDYAKVHEYTRYTSTLIEAWRISIASLNVAMLQVLSSSEEILQPSLDDSFKQTVIDQFSIAEVRKHRARGVTLGMFLGLVKYYRRGYNDLVREQHLPAAVEREYLDFLERFFDRFEIGYSVEWNALNADESVKELQDQNRVLTNEKNKYLTIFESLYDPVILLDRGNLIENVNQAAAELFQAHNLTGHRYYDQHPAQQAFPWLADEIAAFSASGEQELVVVKNLETAQGQRHFQVKMKRMQDVSEKYWGTVLILNDLTERIKKEEALTLNRAILRWVNTLVGLSQRLSSGADTEDVLLEAMSALYELTEPDVAVMGMWEAESGHFRLKYRAGAGGLEKTEHIHVPTPGELEAAATRCIPGFAQDFDQVLSLPLKTNEQPVGRLWVGRTQPRPFNASEKVVLESLAHQMLIAIEHARLTEQIQSGAVVAERARLSREMHDGLAQILGFLSLQMQSLESLVSQGKLDETQAELRRARERIRDAQAEVRENILNLRTVLSKNGEVVPFLCEYIAQFGEQTGIQTHVQCADNPRTSLSPVCEVQLVRIMQEALANVRQHARAENVWVSLADNGTGFEVEIRDDGVGFVERSAERRFGLKSMRERTESVHGELLIDSTPGRGTRIRLRVPRSDT